MTKPDAIDESFSKGNPQQLAAAGIKLVMRYLSPPPNSKNLTSPEAVQLHAAGLAILLGYESQNNRALGGSASGVADGHAAASYAESISAPHGLAIYYAVDFDTNPSMYPVLDAYFAALIQSTAGRYKVGAYAEADVLDHLHSKGLITSEWQTYAWSRGRLSANADLYQYLNGQSMAGATVDFDKIIHPDKLGAWLPPGLSGLGSGTQIGTTPTTPIEGDDMAAVAQSDWNDVQKKVDTMYPAVVTSMLPAVAATRAMVLALYNAHPDTPAITGGDLIAELKSIVEAAVSTLPAQTAADTVAALKAAL